MNGLKITMTRRGNGIHEFIETHIQDPELKDLGVLTKLITVVEAYNAEQVEKA